MPSRLRGKVLGVLGAVPRHELTRAVVLPFVVQRALLVGLVFWATRLIPSEPGVHASPRVALLEPWVRWDSIYYLIAAREGYGPNPWATVDAFFPAYPWLVRGFARLMPVHVAAFAVANACALLAVGALYLLVREIDDQACARRSVWLALVFPSSFFLTAAYAESTYLAALTGCALAWRHRRQGAAAALAAVATLARPMGALCLALPFGLAWLLARRRRQEIPWFLLGVPAGLSLLLLTHQQASGDPLAFLHAPDVEVLGDVVYVRSPAPFWDILWDEGAGANLMRRLLNWSAIALTAAASIHLLRRREIALGLLCVLTLATPLFFQRSVFDAFGMARYALCAFPVFLVLARWTAGELSSRTVGAGFAMFQAILAVVYATWRWGE